MWCFVFNVCCFHTLDARNVWQVALDIKNYVLFLSVTLTLGHDALQIGRAHV